MKARAEGSNQARNLASTTGSLPVAPQIPARSANGLPSPSRPSHSPAEITAFDPNHLMLTMYGRVDVIRELTAIFQRDHLPMLKRIEAAIDARNPSQLEEAAHRMKGSIAMFRAARVTELCADLERAGLQGDFCQAREHLGKLQRLTPSLIQDLNALLTQQG